MLGKKVYASAGSWRPLILWTAVIVMVGVLPLSDFVGHSHWEYIKWVPTGDDLRSPKYLADILLDLIGNTLLFLPFGFFLSRLLFHSPPSRQLMVVASASGFLSLGIEFYQVYCHSRFPSIFDVVTNMAGALMGVRLSISRMDRSPAAQKSPFTPIPPDHTPAP